MFGKLTVIKTLCLPKLNHIVTVVPNPNLTYVRELESEFRLFINDNNPSVVCDITRHMSKKLGGLGIGLFLESYQNVLVKMTDKFECNVGQIA